VSRVGLLPAAPLRAVGLWLPLVVTAGAMVAAWRRRAVLNALRVRYAVSAAGLAALVVLVAPFPALARGTPRSIGECERLKNDLAYNQCLAMFGPAARNVAGG